jgi:hypothetical protein
MQVKAPSTVARAPGQRGICDFMADTPRSTNRRSRYERQFHVWAHLWVHSKMPRTKPAMSTSGAMFMRASHDVHASDV